MYFSSIDPSSFRPRSLICTLRRPRASGGVCSKDCTAVMVQEISAELRRDDRIVWLGLLALVLAVGCGTSANPQPGTPKRTPKTCPSGEMPPSSERPAHVT